MTDSADDVTEAAKTEIIMDYYRLRSLLPHRPPGLRENHVVPVHQECHGFATSMGKTGRSVPDARSPRPRGALGVPGEL